MRLGMSLIIALIRVVKYKLTSLLCMVLSNLLFASVALLAHFTFLPVVYMVREVKIQTKMLETANIFPSIGLSSFSVFLRNISKFVKGKYDKNIGKQFFHLP